MASIPGLGTDRQVPPAQVAAVALLAGGVGAGVASFLPPYLAGSSLASQPALATAHAVTLAGFALATVLAVVAGRPSAGRRPALGLPGALGLGVAAVDLGLVVTDIGQAAAGSSAGGGLVLAAVEWALCAAGGLLAAQPALRGAARPAGSGRRDVVGTVLVAVVGLAVAGLFAPAWDRYVVDLTTVGHTTIFTAGNAFDQPAAMVAGSVLVMAGVVAVAVASALARRAKVGATLLAGAVVVLAGQIASALVLWRIPLAPGAVGLTPARAQALGLRVEAGFTGAFYLFCVSVVLLALLALFRALPGLLVRAVTVPERAPSYGPPSWRPPTPSWPPSHEPTSSGLPAYTAPSYGPPAWVPPETPPAWVPPEAPPGRSG